jgi:hypothetical protein
MHTVIPTRKETVFELAAWPLWIGKQVVKVSGKPFKSKEKANTVTGVVTHPVTGLHGFTFVEDDSVVECFRTVLISGKPSWDEAPSWALGLAFKCYGDPGEMGEWCWMAPNGSPGFICFETRPMTHVERADQKVQDIIMDDYWHRMDQKEEHRQAQSARDRARAGCAQ